MKEFKGTLRLLRLILRLDRIKLGLWVIGILVIVATSAAALSDVYGNYEAQVQYAATTAPSIAGRAFGGLVDGPSLGSIAMVELFNFTAVLIAFMSTMLVVRHTRKYEELGTSEIIGAGSVGRFSGLAAALLAALLTNIVLTIGMLVILSTTELEITGAIGFSLALGAVGILFAGLAAVSAQLAESGRGANSIAGGSIGVAFALRAIGDGFGKVGVDGLSATPIWPTWLSPIGIAYQISPFTSQRWWLFAVLATLIASSVLAAFFILGRRDVGLGLLPSRPGPARAKQNLLRSWGLSWRLQRGTLIGWSVGFLLFGLIIGGMAHEFSDLLASNPEASEALAAFGGSNTSITDVFFGVTFSFAGIIAAGYGVQSILRIRSEEASGHVEPLLATSLSRGKWLISHIGLSFLGSLLLLVVVGTSSAVVHVFASGAAWSEVPRLLIAALNQAPAVLAFSGFVAFIVAATPRFAASISWAAFIGSFMLLQLATLLRLPEWVVNVSPFTHAGAAPSQPAALQSLVVLSIFAGCFTLASFVSFWRRDISSNA